MGSNSAAASSAWAIGAATSTQPRGGPDQGPSESHSSQGRRLYADANRRTGGAPRSGAASSACRTPPSSTSGGCGCGSGRGGASGSSRRSSGDRTGRYVSSSTAAWASGRRGSASSAGRGPGPAHRAVGCGGAGRREARVRERVPLGVGAARPGEPRAVPGRQRSVGRSRRRAHAAPWRAGANGAHPSRQRRPRARAHARPARIRRRASHIRRRDPCSCRSSSSSGAGGTSCNSSSPVFDEVQGKVAALERDAWKLLRAPGDRAAGCHARPARRGTRSRRTETGRDSAWAGAAPGRSRSRAAPPPARSQPPIASCGGGRRRRRPRSARTRTGRCPQPSSAARHELAAIGEPASSACERVAAALEAALVHLGYLLVATRQPQEAAYESSASIRFRSKNSHSCTRVRARRSVGEVRRAVGEVERIAFDSTIVSPSRARALHAPVWIAREVSGVRVSPLKRSTWTRS